MTYERLQRILAYLRTRRLELGLPVLVTGAIAVAYVALTPDWYQSTLTVVPTKPSKPALAALGAGDLLSSAGLDLGGGGLADVDRVGAVLQSTSVSDAVIHKFDLLQRYRERYVEHARKELWNHCAVRVTVKGSLASLTCEDKDPRFVQQMLQYFYEVGNENFRRVSRSSASEEVEFLTGRVEQLRTESDAAARALREFEQKHKLIDLETQSNAVVSGIAALHNQRVSKELELEYLRSFSSPGEATSRQLERQLGIIDSKLRAMEGTASDDDDTPVMNTGENKRDKLFPAALSVPALRFELAKLMRDRRVTEYALVTTMQRLELAKANDARETSAFLILDPPALPTYRYRPKRLLIVASSLLLGLVLGGTLVWRFPQFSFRRQQGES